MSSAAQRRAEAHYDARRQREIEEAKQVSPGVQIILEWIDEELNEVCDLRKMVVEIHDKELARDQLIARDLHMKFLEKLKGRAQKIMRVADRADRQAALESLRKLKEMEKEARDNA
jgi:uncharacterized protein YktA (UPF0223 family)